MVSMWLGMRKYVRVHGVTSYLDSTRRELKDGPVNGSISLRDVMYKQRVRASSKDQLDRLSLSVPHDLDYHEVSLLYPGNN